MTRAPGAIGDRFPGTARGVPYCQAPPTISQQINDTIAADLRTILAAMRGMGRRLDAVLLSGSLGRGEGTVVHRNGAPLLLSDYDIFAVSDDCPNHRYFRNLEAALSARIWGPHVSIGVLSTAGLARLPAAVWSYDLKYGSQVLEGEPAILDAIPAYRPADIPAWEGLKLIFNYSAVLLGATSPSDPSAGASPEDSREFRSAAIQLAYRLGDALVVQARQYHHLLSRRQETLRTLGAFRRLPVQDQELVGWGCKEKVRPTEFWTFDPNEKVRGLLPLVEELLRQYLGDFLASEEPNLTALLAEYREHFPALPARDSRFRAIIGRIFGQNRLELPLPDAACAFDPYHYILSIVPLVLLSLPGVLPRSSYLEVACRLLGTESSHPVMREDEEAWRAAREKNVRLWKKFCL